MINFLHNFFSRSTIDLLQKYRRTAAIMILVVFVSTLCTNSLSMVSAHSSLVLGATSNTEQKHQVGNIQIVPGTTEVSLEIEAAMTLALQDAFGRVVFSEGYAITSVRSWHNWTLLSVIGLRDSAPSTTWSLGEDADWFGLILMLETGEGWHGTVQGTPEFSELIARAPDEFLSSTAKIDLDPLQVDSASVDSVDYILPWKPGTKMEFSSGKGVHGVEFAGWYPNIPEMRGWKAVDFLARGNVSQGEAPNIIYAASDGTIGPLCKDDKSVAFPLGGLLYAHLALTNEDGERNDKIKEGATLRKGDEIGPLRKGSFNGTNVVEPTSKSGTCGYADQKPESYHLHLGFPVTNNLFTIGGWTLNTATEIWSNGTERIGPGGWVTSAPNTYRVQTEVYEWSDSSLGSNSYLKPVDAASIRLIVEDTSQEILPIHIGTNEYHFLDVPQEGVIKIEASAPSLFSPSSIYGSVRVKLSDAAPYIHGNNILLAPYVVLGVNSSFGDFGSGVRCEVSFPNQVLAASIQEDFCDLIQELSDATPPDIPVDPNPSNQPSNNSCDPTQPGVILYANRDYDSANGCVRLLAGKYNLATYNLNDTVSSLRINGNYRVNLYKDADQHGDHGEFNQDDPNLDDDSLGGQWSSVEIINKDKESKCGNEDGDGVYFFQAKNYRDKCYYATEDIADFGDTAIGNDRVSSVAMNGSWRVKVYTGQNFTGKEYSFGDSQPNLDDRSDVGSNISSARIERLPDPCPAPTLRQPTNGATLGQRTLTFTWGGVNCERDSGDDRYRLRIKTAPNMGSSGDTLFDEVVTGTNREVTLDARWERRDLFWSVQVANAKNGAAWATVRQLLVDTNLPPTVTIQQANDQAISANEQFVWGNLSDWSLSGTATDSDGTVAQVSVTCSGQSCDETNAANLTGENWSYQHNGLTGRNHLSAQAIDNLGAVSQAGNVANITLWVDKVPPQTGIVLNNEANPGNWPQWFTDPVVVHLSASDSGSGSGANLARAGVQEIRYRLDDGEWQSQSGDQLYLELTTSGVHTLHYYAVDEVGNAESERTRQIALDLTPPPPPGAATESSGVVNDQWQKSNALPTFSWPAVTDEHSGLWGYQLYFGNDANGEGYHTVLAGAPRQWQPQSTGVTTGVYYLRGRSRDLAGNWSDWSTLFTLRFDNTPPVNPEAARHLGGVESATWQRITSSANFTWTAVLDEGSGFQNYDLYWGQDANGESSNTIATHSYQQPTPLCAAGATCTGYLRLRTRDQVGNVAPSWSTAFVLRYDDTPPTLDFNINGGAATANSSQVTLFINAQDSGSGPAQMRFSEDGVNWVTNWITYTTTQPWVINGISEQSTTVYMQVRDGVGLASPVVSRAIRFESNIPAPSSANFTLFNSTFAAGSGEQLSGNYWLHSTVAEPPDSAPLVSTNYLLLDGYEAGGVAPPAPTTTPLPPAQPTCDRAPIIINDGAAFTGSRQVTVQLCATAAVQMQVSDNPGFNGATWEPYAITKTMTLAAPVAPVAPLYAYARFQLADGTEQGAYADAIYYDATQPSQPQIYIGDPVAGIAPAGQVRSAAVDASGRIAVLLGPNDLVGGFAGPHESLAMQAAGVTAGTNAAPLIDVYIDNQDDLAGVGAIQLSENADFADATWQAIPANNVVNWALSNSDGDKTLYARVQDKAGNVSDATSADFTVDLTPPSGGIELNPAVVGVSTDAVTIYLTAYDNQSGVTDMRLSTDPLLLYGDVWRPYTTTLTIPAYLPLAGELPLYVQFRDTAGNVSEVYSDTYQVDVAAPVITVEVTPGDSLTRTLQIYGYDALSEIATLRLSNDLASLAAATPIAYTTDLTWTFDERKVVWVQVTDSLGNVSEPLAIYADTVVMGNAIYLPVIQR